LALKIGGPKKWSQWRAVSVTFFWTTVELRLLDRSTTGEMNVGAAIMEVTRRGD